MTAEEVRKALETELVVPPWPIAGRALGMGKNATYKAIASGRIPTVSVGGRKKPVSTAWIRARLGLGEAA